MINNDEIKQIYFKYLCCPDVYIKDNLGNPFLREIINIMLVNTNEWTKEYQDKQYIILNNTPNLNLYIETFVNILISSKNIEQLYKLVLNVSEGLIRKKIYNQTLLKHYYDLIFFDFILSETIIKNKFKNIFEYLYKINKKEYYSLIIKVKTILNFKQNIKDYRYQKIVLLLKSIPN